MILPLILPLMVAQAGAGAAKTCSVWSAACIRLIIRMSIRAMRLSAVGFAAAISNADAAPNVLFVGYGF